MLNRFKVKAGSHVEDGKTFTKGQVVVTALDLMSLFPEKFEALGPVTPKVVKTPTLVTSLPAKSAPVDPAPAESAPAEEVEENEDEAPAHKKPAFKFSKGKSHNQAK